MAGLDPSVGLSGLLAAQRGLDVVGHNVANASTPGYTRQALELRAARATPTATAGQAGNGVDIVATRRVADLFADARLREASAGQGEHAAAARRLGELEEIVGRDDAGSPAALLSRFFAGASALAGRPEDAALRGAFLADASALAAGLREQASSLSALRADIAQEATGAVADVNDRAARIAALNGQIVEAQTLGQRPNDLIDQRDVLLRDVTRLTGARALARPDGSVAVTLGGQLLVSGNRAQPLTAAPNPSGAVSIRDAAGRPVTVPGGALAGLAAATSEVDAQAADLDRLARSVAGAANAIHATGVPGGGPAARIVSTTAARDVNATGDPRDDALAAAGLPGPPGATELVVGITDLSTGARAETRIPFDPATGSLADLAAALDAVPGLSASAGPDGLLRLDADPGRGVDLADRAGGAADAGGLLGALGVNPLFTGSGAADLAVAPGATPAALAAGLSAASGDGRNAARLAALGRGALAGLDGQAPAGFLSTLVARAGGAARSAAGLSEGADQAVAGLEARREATSGVSLEEEVASMMKFQRAFQASARWLQVVDTLSGELLRIAGA